MSDMPRRHPVAVLAALSFGCLLLTACGAPKNPPSPTADDAAASDVVGAPLHQALDKANSVEGTIQQQKRDVDDAVDQAN